MKPWKSALLNLIEAPLRFARILFVPAAGLGLRAFRLAGLRMHCKGRIPASTQFDGAVDLLGTGRVILGERCRLGRGVVLETQGEGEIIIGNDVRINVGTIIVSHSKVSIGDDTLIGEYVSIRDANHGTQLDGGPMRLQPHIRSPIAIGSDVWIGRGVCILNGTVIGHGAVVGANSVVTRSISERSICAGVPAKVIGDRK